MSGGLSNARGGASRFLVTLTGCLFALVLLAVLTARHVLVDIPAEVARRTSEGVRASARQIAEDVARAFEVRPTVAIGSETIVTQETAAAKFVVLEREARERYRFEHSWLHSRKTFEVEGRFLLRAGFDLAKPFSVRMSETGNELNVRLPRAEMLGAELQDLKIVQDEDGLWNKITAEDREAAIAALRKQALRAAEDGRMPEHAQAAAEENLRRLLSRPDRSVTIEAGK